MTQRSAAKKRPFLDDDLAGRLPEETPKLFEQLPWETSEEFARFHAWLGSDEESGRRSVRAAYRRHCGKRSVKPAKSPPASWYTEADGRTARIREAEAELRALELAEQKHGLVPNWERLELAAFAAGELGKYDGPVGDVWDGLVLIRLGFWSLAIDLEGNRVGTPWEERVAAFLEAKAAGKV